MAAPMVRNPLDRPHVAWQQDPRIVRHKSFLLLVTIWMACVSGTLLKAQRGYLDQGLDPTSQSLATYYVELSASKGSMVSASIFTMDGVLKAQGTYLDKELSTPHGHFTFFFPNGKVESSGDYAMGRKCGVWQRYDKFGDPLAEKVYDTEVLGNIVFTTAQTMPEYPGGERALVRYLRNEVGRTKGDATASFIVEIDGHVSTVKVTGLEDQQVAERVVEAMHASPRWQSGVQDGRPVRVQMRVPIN